MDGLDNQCKAVNVWHHRPGRLRRKVKATEDGSSRGDEVVAFRVELLKLQRNRAGNTFGIKFGSFL